MGVSLRVLRGHRAVISERAAELGSLCWGRESVTDTTFLLISRNHTLESLAAGREPSSSLLRNSKVSLKAPSDAG